MTLKDDHVKWAKWVMLSSVGVVMSFLFIWIVLDSVFYTKYSISLTYWKCLFSYMTLLGLPCAGIPLVIYLIMLGYHKGLNKQCYQNSSKGTITGSEAVKMGWTQIIGSFFTLSLGVIVSILLWRNYQTAFHCPSEFYELTWWEVLQKLY